MDGFESWCHDHVDEVAIRRALNESEIKFDGSSQDVSDYPPCVAKLSPNHVFVYDDRAELRWGGGFFSWGIVIGLSDNKVSDSEIELSDNPLSRRFGDHSYLFAD